jgi:hypothetical protein
MAGLVPAISVLWAARACHLYRHSGAFAKRANYGVPLHTRESRDSQVCKGTPEFASSRRPGMTGCVKGQSEVVGWVERSETHRPCRGDKGGGFRCALPNLRQRRRGDGPYRPNLLPIISRMIWRRMVLLVVAASCHHQSSSFIFLAAATKRCCTSAKSASV